MTHKMLLHAIQYGSSPMYILLDTHDLDPFFAWRHAHTQDLTEIPQMTIGRAKQLNVLFRLIQMNSGFQ